MRRASAPRRRAVLAAAALAFASCSSDVGMPSPDTDRARSTLDLSRLLTVAGVVVGAIVVALIAWCLVRYRDRGDERPAGTFRDHLPLEITYTAIPLLIVAALFLATFRTEQEVDALGPSPDVTVRVTAFDWGWRFEYPELGVVTLGSTAQAPELVLPAGERVRFELTSNDVIHAFFVPGFLFKRDAIPGHVNTFELVPEDPGTVLRGECAEFCGLNHAYMQFTVRILTPADFAAWASAAAASPSAGPPAGGSPAVSVT